MKKTRMAVTVLLVGMMALSGVGCKKLMFWRKTPKIDPAGLQTGGTPYGTGLTTPGPAGAGEGWGGMGPGDRLPPRDGEIIPVQDARLQGIVVYFAFDSSAIGDAEKPKVEALAAYLKENAGYAVLVEGHCDERGSDEYNRGLAERRALAVREYLVSLGIADGRIDTLSFGEERPAVANAASESEHAQNRRAEFVVGVRHGGAPAAE
jgi:peptidoglycan-associated lipoprotein